MCVGVLKRKKKEEKGRKWRRERLNVAGAVRGHKNTQN